MKSVGVAAKAKFPGSFEKAGPVLNGLWLDWVLDSSEPVEPTSAMLSTRCGWVPKSTSGDHHPVAFFVEPAVVLSPTSPCACAVAVTRNTIKHNASGVKKCLRVTRNL